MLKQKCLQKSINHGRDLKENFFESLFISDYDDTENCVTYKVKDPFFEKKSLGKNALKFN